MIAATSLVISLKLDSNRRFFSSCDLDIWWITSINYRAPLYTLHQALCIISNPSVNSNWSYCPETLNSGQNQRFFACVTLKFDGWPWKTIGHFFYVTLSFVHHFKAISEFKLELLSGNAQLGSKLAIYCHMWPSNLTDDLIKQTGTSSMLHHYIAISELKLKLQSRNAQFGSKSAIFLSCGNMKFDRWPWKTIGQLS